MYYDVGTTRQQTSILYWYSSIVQLTATTQSASRDDDRVEIESLSPLGLSHHSALYFAEKLEMIFLRYFAIV